MYNCTLYVCAVLSSLAYRAELCMKAAKLFAGAYPAVNLVRNNRRKLEPMTLKLKVSRAIPSELANALHR
jgi:hypothetical protein